MCRLLRAPKSGFWRPEMKKIAKNFIKTADFFKKSSKGGGFAPILHPWGRYNEHNKTK